MTTASGRPTFLVTALPQKVIGEHGRQAFSLRADKLRQLLLGEDRLSGLVR